MNILDIQNLTKTYDAGNTFALQNVSFTLEQGKICAVVGKSGSGKTTLLRLIAGLERSDLGKIIINGQLVSSDESILPPQQRNVGMVFQSYALFPHLTVAENIGYGLGKNEKEKIQTLLSIIELEGFEHRYPDELSGGEQQRVAIARTLAQDPPILLLDEPFGNLDTDLKANIRTEIYRIVKKINITVLFITHDIGDAMAIADEVIFLKDGKMLEKGTLPDLYKNASTPEVNAIFNQLAATATQTLKSLEK